MKNIFIVLSLALFPSGALAENPDWLRDNASLIAWGACTDHESQEGGTCFLFEHEATSYLVFAQDGVPVFVRRTTPMGYEQVWPTHRPGGSLH